MNWMRNVRSITATWSHDSWSRLKHLFALFAVEVLFSLFGVGWNEVAGVPVFCELPLADYASGRGRDAVITIILSELFSWGWLLAFGIVALPGLLLPLAASHSTSQSLWLRLSGASPRQVAASRAALVFIATAVVTAFSGSWAAAASWYHSVPLDGLLRPVFGLAEHLLLAAGFVSVFAPVAPSNRARQVIGFVGVLLPVVLFLVYVAALSRLETSTRFWWPYAAPFVYDSIAADSAKHAFACLIAGGMLTLTPVFIQFGGIVEATSIGSPRGDLGMSWFMKLPRWVRVSVFVVLISPNVIGCGGPVVQPVAAVLYRFIVYIGDAAVKSAIGTAIEKRVDELWNTLFGKATTSVDVNDPNYVTDDPSNPLKGRMSGPIKVRSNKTSPSTSSW